MIARPPWFARQPPRDVPPSVDDGGVPNSLDALLPYLKPFPGRLANTLRVSGLSLAVIVIGETFRLPETSLIAYIPLIFFKEDADVTILLAPAACLAVVLAIVTSILIFMIGLSEPALRLPLMGLVVFATMYLSRASSLGPLMFIVAFLVMYTQKQGDDVMVGALSGSLFSNNTSLVLPEIAFLPVEEALVHNLLYLALSVALPTLAILIVNRLTMRDPVLKLRDALADRFSAAAAFCEGEVGARERLIRIAKEGSARLIKQNDLSGKLAKRPHDPQVGAAVINGLSRLVLALLAWSRVDHEEATAKNDLAAFGCTCRRIDRTLREGGDIDRRGPIADAAGPPTATGAAAPLVDEMRGSLRLVESALQTRGSSARDAQHAREKKGGLLKPDAFSNPAYAHFALKVTLSTTLIYACIGLSDWSRIGTAIITGFLVALDSVGQSARKAILRLSGAVVGGLAGIATIILIMPLLTDIGDLLLVLAPVVLAGAWIGVGSERIAYFGQQAAFAFFLAVIQDYGPTLDFQTARDRMVGILFGELVVFLVFTSLWPVSIADVVRKNLADALDQLAKLLGPCDARNTQTEQRRDALRRGFGVAIDAARNALPDAKLEPIELRPPPALDGAKRRAIDNDMLTQIQALIIPAVLIAREHATREAALGDTDREALSAWMRRFAAWMRTGEGAADLRHSLPNLSGPSLSSGTEDATDHVASAIASSRPEMFTTWHDVLRGQLVRILDRIGPEIRSIAEAKPVITRPISRGGQST